MERQKDKQGGSISESVTCFSTSCVVIYYHNEEDTDATIGIIVPLLPTSQYIESQSLPARSSPFIAHLGQADEESNTVM